MKKYIKGSKTIRDLKNLYRRFAFAKTDKSAIVNNTVLFVLAWFCSFWIFQLFTILPAFSIGARMIIYANDVDFSKVNAVSANSEIWSDTDNIMNIFCTPLIMSFVLIVVACLYLFRFTPRGLNKRRFLFWLIVCATVRLCGNYVSGSLFGNAFNIWQWNLVTDFLRVTIIPLWKYLFVVLMFAILYVCFRSMATNIRLLFNPFFANRVNNLVSNIFFPMSLGLLFVFLYNLPDVSPTDMVCLVLMFLFTCLIMCRHFLLTYRGIAEEIEKDEPETIAKRPLFLLFLVLVFKIVFLFLPNGGLYLVPSQYRHLLLENALLIAICLVAFHVVIIPLSIVMLHRKYRKMRLQARVRDQEREIEQSLSKDNLDAFGLQKKNLDKYKTVWTDSNPEDLPELKDENTAKPKDLEKYRRRWEEK